MAKSQFTQLSPNLMASHVDPNVRRLVKPSRHKAQWPKARIQQQGVPARVSAWQKTRQTAAAKVLPVPTVVPFKALKFSSSDLTRLRSLATTSAPAAEAVSQGFDSKNLPGLLYSAVTTNTYRQMRAEFQRRLAISKTPSAKAKVNQEWATLQKASSLAFERAGLRLDSKSVDALERSLMGSKENAAHVSALAAASRDEATAGTLQQLVPDATYVVGTAVHSLPIDKIFSLGDLCDFKIADSYTKVLSDSVSWDIRLTVWCPTWSDPFRTCEKTFTIAGASYKLSVNVGYEIDCDGFAAWGCGYAEACATILGFSVCASCEGCVVGAAAIGQEIKGGDTCVYGAGAEISVTCKFAGNTIFTASYDLGLVIEAPCISPDGALILDPQFAKLVKQAT